MSPPLKPFLLLISKFFSKMCIKTAQREHLIRRQAAAVWFLKTHRPIFILCLILGRCCLPLLKQGFLSSSSGTEGSKHNVLYCTYINITFNRIWHSSTKDFGTPAPHPACLWIISMPKSLWPQGTLRQEGAGERAEHRTQAPHLDSAVLSTLQLPKPR